MRNSFVTDTAIVKTMYEDACMRVHVLQYCIAVANRHMLHCRYRSIQYLAYHFFQKAVPAIHTSISKKLHEYTGKLMIPIRKQVFTTLHGE